MPEDTEAKIFEAAREEFVARGYTGARMQHIADRVGINKSMLHYYYRSKEKLFQAVYRESVERVFRQVPELWAGEMSILQRIERFVSGYTDLLLENPYLPGFIVFELQRNPHELPKLMAERMSEPYQRIRNEVQQAVEKGEIHPIEPEHLLTTIISLCAFPFVARPMLEKITGIEHDDFRQFLIERKIQVTEFIQRALVP